MKIGFDFHGVIDSLPFLFQLSQLLVCDGHEVHIITGEKDSEEFRDTLESLDIFILIYFLFQLII